jgi:chondroitin AC lyase
LFLFLFFSYAQQDKSFLQLQSMALTVNADVFEYDVVAVGDQSITIDAKKTDIAWNTAGVIRSFVNPWDTVCTETSLSMVYDNHFLYFFFEVKDKEIVLVSGFSGKRDVELEDRVELFFSKDPDMQEYYGFEIDPMERVLSYRAHYYRTFDFSWDPPEGFSVAGQIHSDGYSVEGRIPFTFLKDFIHENFIYFGAYRADFSKKGDTLIENWQTWRDPKTAFPDFHVPSSLGKLFLR